MVLKDKETWKQEKFGRLIEPNEIIIEDLDEQDLLSTAFKMAKVGYNVEYWKSPKQDSGHLHIKGIVFPNEPKLNHYQLNRYKELIIKKYVRADLLDSVDWNFYNRAKGKEPHRIAAEGEEHPKGYGIKSLVKEWNEGKTNFCEKEVFFSIFEQKHDSRGKPIEVSNLDLKTYEYYKKLKKNKNYIVEDFLFPGSINMIYSPPAEFKSLLIQNMCMSISNGKDWLGFKTKKMPVLYLDGENADRIIKERLEMQHKGMKLRRNKFPFFILKGGELITQKKQVHIGFMAALEAAIEENKIKVLVFDTLHRFAFYDENKSDDINLLYTKVFQPLVQTFGVSIVFLHHSKKDGGYRGSGDFLGSVDVSYRVSRKKGTNSFTIINEKCRSGEIANINGEIEFGEDYIRFHRRDEQQEEEKRINKLKEVTNKIYEAVEFGTEVKRKEIVEILEMQKFKYGDIKTITRSLKFLCDIGKFSKTERGVYQKIR